MSDYLIDYVAGYSHHTLVYQFDIAEGRGGWVADAYSPGVAVHYGEEGIQQDKLLVGGDDGSVYQMKGVDDNGTEIGCRVRSRAEDIGDRRQNKLFGDVWFDVTTQYLNIQTIMGYDNFTILSAGSNLYTTKRDDIPIDPDSNTWQRARNIGIDLAWKSNVEGVKLYAWSPRWHEETGPLGAKSWVLPETDFGLGGFLYSGYLYLPHRSTADLTLTFTIDGTAQSDITISHGSNAVVKTFQRLPVMKAKLWKIKLSSANNFYVLGNEAELLLKKWGEPSPWIHIPMFRDMATSELAS